jgi:hypothetical protein
MSATGATGEQVKTGRKAGEEDGRENEETSGREDQKAGMTEGEGERGPSGNDGKTAPVMAMSPS